MTSPNLPCVDLFCGAGGLSEGLKHACADLNLPLDLLAINHWNVAIDTHKTNHPDARQLCMSVEGVNPLDVVPGGVLELLCAAPECTYHSRARGGGPLNEQSRATAWDILRWAQKLHIKNILIENVSEFIEWGPIYPLDHVEEKLRGRPIAARKGEYFRLFVRNLRALDYTVDWRILRAADYGDPTTRKRFFLQAKKQIPGKRRRITWPEPTHYPRQSLPLSGTGQTWKPARDIIDWNLPGHSIYLSPEEAKKVGVRRPLAPNTLRRIFAGLEKFCGIPFLIGCGGPEGAANPASVDDPCDTLLTENHRGVVTPSLVPYLVILRHTSDAQSMDAPAPALCAGGTHLGLAQPYIVVNRTHNTPTGLHNPIPTLTTGNQMGLAQPFLMQVEHSSSVHAPMCREVENPLNTVTAKAMFSLVQPFLMQCEHSSEGHSRRCQDMQDPLHTVTGNAAFSLVQPYLLGQHSQSGLRPDSEPVPTICKSGAISLIHPHLTGCLIKYHGSHKGQDDGSRRVHNLDDALPAVDCSNRIGVVQPFLTGYYGNGQAHSLDDSCPTLTTHDRFGLVQTRLLETGALKEGDTLCWLDILFRMLQPHELAGAHSFPKHYTFTGGKDEQVAQIGNSVPVCLATALCTEMLRDACKPARKPRRKETVDAG